MRLTEPVTGNEIRLDYQPPYDIPAMLGFFETRQIGGIEFIRHGETPALGRSLALLADGQSYKGWLLAAFDAPRHQVCLRVSDSLAGVLPQVLHRVRDLLDLDADPTPINQRLCASFPGSEGLRVPGTVSGHELAIRAILGQQITVAAARTLAQRLVERFGEPLATPFAEITRLFPSAQKLAQASGDALGQLGIVRQRQAAIVAVSRAVAEGRLQLERRADVQASIVALKALPGIGDWTAQYIAMRALRHSDAFPCADVALQRALGVRTASHPARAAESASQAWKPWRSYAVIRAWRHREGTASFRPGGSSDPRDP